MPVSRLAISDRGVLKKNAWADISVFDAEQIESHCDVSEPRRYATGIAHVLVNGVFSMFDGARTDGCGGQVLRSR